MASVISGGGRGDESNFGPEDGGQHLPAVPGRFHAQEAQGCAVLSLNATKY